MGRQIEQAADYTVSIQQNDYIRQVSAIYLPKARRSTPESPVTEDERKALRALLGKLIWVARQTMPQIAYDVSDLQQRVTTARITDLVRANSVVRQMHNDMKNGYTPTPIHPYS